MINYTARYKKLLVSACICGNYNALKAAIMQFIAVWYVITSILQSGHIRLIPRKARVVPLSPVLHRCIGCGRYMAANNRKDAILCNLYHEKCKKARLEALKAKILLLYGSRM